ncbi:MAG: class I SAM-dependent methyltransferase [Bacteroidia bacterium]|nr:class I SAM-dependent methyltransferase [Bacteroidia bacterium]
MNVELSGVPETLLITVRARAEETLRTDALLSDSYAVDILTKLEPELSSKRCVARSSQVGVVIRTLIFDRITVDFLKRHPDGVVVALGCGLDARFERLQLPCTCWFDLDVPESMCVRQAFFHEKDNYKMLAKSMLDRSWMDEIPLNKHLLILSEGVWMYFHEDEVRKLCLDILHRFPQAELVFDTIPTFLAKRSNLHSEVRKYNAPFHWGLDEVDDLKKWHNAIKIISVDYVMNQHLKRWPLSMRLLRLIPKINKGTKVVHLALE